MFEGDEVESGSERIDLWHADASGATEASIVASRRHARGRSREADLIRRARSRFRILVALAAMAFLMGVFTVDSLIAPVPIWTSDATTFEEKQQNDDETVFEETVSNRSRSFSAATESGLERDLSPHTLGKVKPEEEATSIVVTGEISKWIARVSSTPSKDSICLSWESVHALGILSGMCATAELILPSSTNAARSPAKLDWGSGAYLASVRLPSTGIDLQDLGAALKGSSLALFFWDSTGRSLGAANMTLNFPSTVDRIKMAGGDSRKPLYGPFFVHALPLSCPLEAVAQGVGGLLSTFKLPTASEHVEPEVHLASNLKCDVSVDFEGLEVFASRTWCTTTMVVAYWTPFENADMLKSSEGHIGFFLSLSGLERLTAYADNAGRVLGTQMRYCELTQDSDNGVALAILRVKLQAPAESSGLATPKEVQIELSSFEISDNNGVRNFGMRQLVVLPINGSQVALPISEGATSICGKLVDDQFADSVGLVTNGVGGVEFQVVLIPNYGVGGKVELHGELELSLPIRSSVSLYCDGERIDNAVYLEEHIAFGESTRPPKGILEFVATRASGAAISKRQPMNVKKTYGNTIEVYAPATGLRGYVVWLAIATLVSEPVSVCISEWPSSISVNLVRAKCMLLVRPETESGDFSPTTAGCIVEALSVDSGDTDSSRYFDYCSDTDNLYDLPQIWVPTGRTYDVRISRVNPWNSMGGELGANRTVLAETRIFIAQLERQVQVSIKLQDHVLRSEPFTAVDLVTLPESNLFQCGENNLYASTHFFDSDMAPCIPWQKWQVLYPSLDRDEKCQDELMLKFQETRQRFARRHAAYFLDGLAISSTRLDSIRVPTRDVCGVLPVRLHVSILRHVDSQGKGSNESISVSLACNGSWSFVDSTLNENSEWDLWAPPGEAILRIDYPSPSTRRSQFLRVRLSEDLVLAAEFKNHILAVVK